MATKAKAKRRKLQPARLGLRRPEPLSPERQAAWDRLLARLEKGVTVGVPNDEVRSGRFDRDWAHER